MEPRSMPSVQFSHDRWQCGRVAGSIWVAHVYSYANDYGAFCDASAKATSNRMIETVVD